MSNDYYKEKAIRDAESGRYDPPSVGKPLVERVVDGVVELGTLGGIKGTPGPTADDRISYDTAHTAVTQARHAR